jgi:hypothetical protein
MVSNTQISFRPQTAHISRNNKRGVELRTNNWTLGDENKTPGQQSFVTSNMINYKWV